ncbi:MAG: redox-regulated ATPase YchF [Nitrospinaceae bacterium]
MGFTCGLVGLPNVGKTVIFNALTRSNAESSNYAFSTSKPNIGVVDVPDPRLDIIDRLVPAKKKVPTTMQFVDIAGLVKGASRGEGLGNQFLANIREMEAIAHVVRCFDDDNIPHVHDKIDPASDIDEINTELMIADLETLEKRKTKLEKLAKSGDKDARNQIGVITRLMEAFDDNQPARSVEFQNPAEQTFVKTLNLLTVKPVLYVCNVADPSEMDGLLVRQVKEVAEAEGTEVVALAGQLENELLEIEDPDELKEFLDDMQLEEPGFDRMIHAGYRLLGLETYFTVGEQENRAWTIHKNTKAPQAAGKIHSDFEKGFIKAVVYNYDDLVQYQSEHAVKEAGKLRLEGKNYVVQDGDIMHFRFNV